jgi:hypothetical protein
MAHEMGTAIATTGDVGQVLGAPGACVTWLGQRSGVQIICHERFRMFRLACLVCMCNNWRLLIRSAPRRMTTGLLVHCAGNDIDQIAPKLHFHGPLYGRGNHLAEYYGCCSSRQA